MRILLITDSHLAAMATPFVANWHAAAGWAARSSIDLTIHLGDITLDAINVPAQLAEAKALVDAWPTPIRLVPGNHDIGDNVGSIGIPERAWVQPQSIARYRAVFGENYWACDAGAWRLIALDAQLLAGGDDEDVRQWAWLDAEVGSARERPVIVIIHKPLFEYPETDVDHQPRYLPKAARDRLLATLAPIDTRLIVCGHAHQHLDRTIDGIRHVWMPSCAFIIPDPHQRRTGEKIVGIGLLELNDADYRLDVIAAEGLVRHDITRLPALAMP